MTDGESRTLQPVAPRGGLLVVHAHPDDETLTNGALMATWAAAGERVAVVTCTRGERGEVIGAELAHLEGDGTALAAHREIELENALAALGVTEHHFLDQRVSRTEYDDVREPVRYEDSGMAWVSPGVADRGAQIPPAAFVNVPLDDVAARLAEIIREVRPSMLATYEPGGGYGHPDHIRAYEAVVRAVERTPAPERPDLWWTVIPSGAMRRAREELAATPAPVSLTAPPVEGPYPSIVVSDDVARQTSVVDVAPVLGAVVSALRAHATQIQAVERLAGPAAIGRYALSNDVLAPILPYEYYLPARTASTR